MSIEFDNSNVLQTKLERSQAENELQETRKQNRKIEAVIWGGLAVVIGVVLLSFALFVIKDKSTQKSAYELNKHEVRYRSDK